MNKEPLEIFNTTASDLPLTQLQSVTRSIYRSEQISVKRRVNLICCTDYRIRKLNRDYRDKDKVTDVLSFPFPDADFLGEIYISLKRVDIQSRRYGLSFNDEFLRLYIHGLLHLCGYDHLLESERTIMEKVEKKFLDKFFITIDR